MIYCDELARLAARRDGLEVTHTLTRDAPAGWRGHARRTDHEMLVEVLPGPRHGRSATSAGATPLVESFATLLVSLGHAAERIRTERFGPTGGR